MGCFSLLVLFHPQVNRVLPDWLSSPSVIKADVRLNKLPVTQMSGLDPEFVEKLAENDITHFFPGIDFMFCFELFDVCMHVNIIKWF